MPNGRSVADRSRRSSTACASSAEMRAARARRTARRARRSSVNWSRLAQAGDSSTASPRLRQLRSRARPPRRACRRARRWRVVPASARSIAGASRPISSTARQCASTASAAARSPVPCRRRRRSARPGRPRPASAARVAATVVPFESSTNSTPPASAIFCIRCGRPSKRASAASTRRSIFDDSRRERERGERVQRVVPADERADPTSGASSAPPRASHVSPGPARLRAAIDEAPGFFRLGHAGAERLHEAAGNAASRASAGRRGSAPGCRRRRRCAPSPRA